MFYLNTTFIQFYVKCWNALHKIFQYSNTSCCQSDRQTFDLPIRCFERNDCIGLHWISDDPCSKKYRDSIEEKIKEEIDNIKEESENVNDNTDYSF